MSLTAAEICARNTAAAKAKDEAARAKLRADFPGCVEITMWMKAAGFEGFRVVAMEQEGRSWIRS